MNEIEAETSYAFFRRTALKYGNQYKHRTEAKLQVCVCVYDVCMKIITHSVLYPLTKPLQYAYLMTLNAITQESSKIPPKKLDINGTHSIKGSLTLSPSPLHYFIPLTCMQ